MKSLIQFIKYKTRGLFLFICLGLLTYGAIAQNETPAMAEVQHYEAPVSYVDMKIKSTAKENPKCIIVVGAFERKENADRKVQYLAKKGLDQLYRGMHNGKEYLGVPVDCNTPDMDSYLSDFQYRYIADAWVFTLPSGK